MDMHGLYICMCSCTIRTVQAQELAASISKTEQDTRDCVAEIESLKSAR